MMSLHRAFALLAVIVFVTSSAGTSNAVDYVFNVAGGGMDDWWVANNWTPLGNIPNSVNDRAIFNAPGGGTTNTHPSSPYTIRELEFDTPGNWRLHNNVRDLRLDAPGAGQALVTQNNSGTVTFDIDLILVDNTLVGGAGSGEMRVNGSIFGGPGITGGGSLTKSGNFMLRVNSNSNYTGGTILTGGSIFTTNSGALGSGALTMDGGTLRSSVNLGNNIVLNNTTNTFRPSGAYRQLTGQISGPGGFNLANGGGTTGLQLTNPANNFGGDVTINGGATYLRLSASEVIPNTANVINNGNLRLDVSGGGTETIAGLSGSGTVWVPLGNNNLHTLVIGANNADSTYNGRIGVPGQNNNYLGWTKIGNGTLTLTNAGSQSKGPVNLNGGVVSVASLAGGNTPSTLGAAPGYNSNFGFDGGTLRYTGGSVGINRPFRLNAGGGTIEVTNPGTTLTFTDSGGANNITGPGALTKLGPGTLRLTGAANASGGVVVNQGTLQLQGNRNFNQGFFTNVNNLPITINAGATLEALSSWNLRSNNFVDINGGTLKILSENYLNNITMDEGTITTSLGGVPWRTGNFANGVIDVNNTGAGSSNISGRLVFVGTGAAPTTTFNVADGTAPVDLTVSSFIFDHPTFEGKMRLVKTGAGTMRLTSPSSSWDGGVSINDGTISVPQLTGGNGNGPLGGANGTAAFLSFDGGTLQYTGGSVGGINRSFTLNAGGGTIDITNPGTTVTWTDASGAGPIVGPGSLTKTGAGTLVISDLTGGGGQSNSYSGGTLVDNGKLAGISAGTATSPFGTGPITLNGANDTALMGRGGDTIIGNNVVVTGGAGSTTIGTDSGGRTIYNGTININKDVTFRGSATDRTTYTNVISGIGNVTVNGGNRTTWEANNTFVGDVDIQGVGTVLQVGNAGNNQVPDASNVNVGSGARFHLVFDDETIAGLTGTGTVAFFPGGALGASTLSIGAGGATSTFDGVIENGSPSAMSIAKIDSGTLTFNGNHTYTGTTDVDAGTLLLNGTHSGAGNYNIASGATLGGDGTINLATGASVNVAGTPGDISPGPGYTNASPADPAHVGTFTIAAGSSSELALDMDGILLIDIVDPATHDLLNIATGTVEISGTPSTPVQSGDTAFLEINGTQDLTTIDYWGDLDFEFGDRVDFLIAPDGIVGNFENLPVNREFSDAGGKRVFFGNDGTSLYVQAVPEPASIVVWTLLGLALVGYARRRKVMG